MTRAVAALREVVWSLGHGAVAAATDAPYSRELLVVTADAELMLATWRAGQRCAPHDHGGATGAVAVVDGAFVERRFDWRGRALVEGEPRPLPTDAVREIDATLVHSLEAIRAGRTLHLYLRSAAAARTTRVFDLERRGTWLVPDDHGAWLPAPGTADTSFEPWASAS